MPRIRTIKPEFWTSEDVVGCSRDARLLFVGMWNFCDDRGVHPASIKRLKMEVLPNDDCPPQMIEGWIRELVDATLLREFTTENREFWWVTGWHHQRIDRPHPRYPAPPVDGSYSTRARRVIDERSTTDTETEGKRKRKGNGNGRETEGKGREGKTTTGRPVDRTEVEKIDWERTERLVATLVIRIQRKWKRWSPGPAVLEKLAKATACVVLGVLPDEWILNVVDEMISDPKPKNFPHRWLGKVLASTAKELGVDFDAYQRAITVPKKGGDA